MQNTTEPGVIPEYQKKLQGLTATSRQMLAIMLGVSDRTLLYWAKGTHKPRQYAAQRIMKWNGKL